MKKKIILGISFILMSLLIIGTFTIQADDDEDNGEDDDNEGFANDLAYVSIGLFVVTGITVIIYQINRYSRKLLGDEGKEKETKEKIGKIYRSVRKPMNYIHYFVGFTALITLLIHGIMYSNKDETLVVIGWVTTAFYIFYVLSGIVFWLKINPFWKIKNLRQILYKIHRNLFLFIGIVIMHIVHVILAD